jgi:hypothetical protein
MFDKNVAIFDGLQLKVVEQLFAEYSKMVEETEEIKSEDLKK